MTLRGNQQARVLMASLALVCLLCQASTLVHLALVAHQACAEHGELIDAADAPRLAAPAAPLDGAALERPNGPSREHSHDHCAVVATRREHERASQAAVAVVHHEQAEQPPCAEAVFTSARRVLDVAPKNSPPA